jgi:nucleoside-diphosphate-sugar epimerase
LNPKSKILVTGGTGLVGSHLLVQLIQQGKKVRALHRKSSDLNKVKRVFSYYTDDFDNLFNAIEWVEADVTDVPSLEPIFTGIEQVYHCAAIVSFRKNDEAIMRKINIEGTANMVNLSLDNQVKKFCHMSSIATLDKKEGKDIIDETDEWNPENNNYDYAITKYGAEMEVWRASQEGLPVVIVNPGVILGAGFWKHNTGRFFTNAANNFKYYTTGKTGFVGVRDVVKVMYALMESTIKNNNYILVSENVTFQYLMTSIAKALGTQAPTKKVSKLMASIAWRLAGVQAFFTGKQPLITQHSAKASRQIHLYSSKKIIQDLDYKFESLTTTINRNAKLFLIKN